MAQKHYGDGEAYKKDSSGQNCRHTNHMYSYIDGVMVVSPVLLLISNSKKEPAASAYSRSRAASQGRETLQTLDEVVYRCCSADRSLVADV
jgi:hypothetical protein